MGKLKARGWRCSAVLLSWGSSPGPSGSEGPLRSLLSTSPTVDPTGGARSCVAGPCCRALSSRVVWLPSDLWGREGPACSGPRTGKLRGDVADHGKQLHGSATSWDTGGGERGSSGTVSKWQSLSHVRSVGSVGELTFATTGNVNVLDV